jgi:hypothetical protein
MYHGLVVWKISVILALGLKQVRNFKNFVKCVFMALWEMTRFKSLYKHKLQNKLFALLVFYFLCYLVFLVILVFHTILRNDFIYL